MSSQKIFLPFGRWRIQLRQSLIQPTTHSFPKAHSWQQRMFENANRVIIRGKIMSKDIIWYVYIYIYLCILILTITSTVLEIDFDLSTFWMSYTLLLPTSFAKKKNDETKLHYHKTMKLIFNFIVLSLRVFTYYNVIQYFVSPLKSYINWFASTENK